MRRKEVVGPIIVKVFALYWFLVHTLWGRQSFKELDKMDQYKHLLDLETSVREGIQVS